MDEIRISDRWVKPKSGKVSCKISSYAEYTGRKHEYNGRTYPHDLDPAIHEGFTVETGSTLYWEMIWHSSGSVSIYNKETSSRRWLTGEETITIYFK